MTSSKLHYLPFPSTMTLEVSIDKQINVGGEGINRYTCEERATQFSLKQWEKNINILVDILAGTVNCRNFFNDTKLQMTYFRILETSNTNVLFLTLLGIFLEQTLVCPVSLSL